MASATLETTTGKGNEPYEGPDMISELPDPLLCMIISFLPTEEAVALSVLSRRWRCLWMFLSRLDFDPWRNIRQYWSSTQDPHPYIDEVLKKQLISIITSCRIVHRPDAWASSGQLQNWVTYLKDKKRIEELALSVRWNILDYGFARIPKLGAPPYGTFCSTTLRMLELSNYIIEDVNPFRGCTNLETLKLNSVGFVSHETLVKVIQCLFLDNLILKNCATLSKVMIRDKRLKRFELHNMRVTLLDLNLDSLIVLGLNNFSCTSTHMFINCPSLRVLQVYPGIFTSYKPTVSWRASEFLARISGLVGQEASELTNLRTLCTCLDLDGLEDNITLRYIFRVWSKLEKLDITNKVDPRTDRWATLPLEYTFWARDECPDSISHHLKEVKIRSFRGHAREMKLVDHLIRNASKLEKLLIKFETNACPGKDLADIKRVILSVPRSSLNVSIILD